MEHDCKEMICKICGESWPLTSEFYYYNYGQLVQPCKACWMERYRPGEKRSKHKPFSKIEIQDMHAFYEAKMSVEEIANYFQCSKYTIIEWFHKLGLRRTIKWSRKMVSELHDRYLEGMTQAEIGLQYGVTQANISYLFKKYGFKTQGRNRHKRVRRQGR